MNQTQSLSQKRYEIKTDREIVEMAIWYAETQVGVSNVKHKWAVKRYLKSVRLRHYNSFCAAGLYWCFMMSIDWNNLELLIPLTKTYGNPLKRTGLANGQYNHFKRNGILTPYYPQRGDMITWKKANSMKGHIEIVISVYRGGWVTTVGFNVDKRKVKYKMRNIYSHHGSKLIRGLCGFSY